MQYYIKTEYIIRQICKYFSLINLSRSTLFPELLTATFVIHLMRPKIWKLYTQKQVIRDP